MRKPLNWKPTLIFFLTLFLSVGPKTYGLELQLLPERVFAPNSFWYQPIPYDAPLHPNSAGFAQDFVRQMKQFYGTVSINLYRYASPVYIVAKDEPTVRVRQWDCQKKGSLDRSLALEWAVVPIPPYAKSADGNDGEMTVYQPETDSLWEFWKARKVDGEWQACWGGRVSPVSKSDGVFPSYYGTTATSLPFAGGQITAEELQKGEINHVMGIALVETETYKIFSWPAHRSDGLNPDGRPNRIPEGLRFRLDPSVDVDKLNLHPVGRMVAKAAQKYGFVVWDKAGAITLRAQNPLSYTTRGIADPYAALWAGTPNWAILKGIPWDRLQFMPMDYGKP